MIRSPFTTYHKIDIYHSTLLHPHKCSNPLRSLTLEQGHLVLSKEPWKFTVDSPELGR